ncbi:MAG: hypothetical protein OEZ01_14120, partial [Candidatus Heimdallarchaeota archaeon]|nr:hypothetical protein [Candidatus Heimdallarchaeota archaeon]
MKDSNLILTNPNEISKIFTTLRHPTSQILMNYLLYKNKQDYVWWTVSALHQATKKSESTIKTTLKKFIELSLVKTTKAKHVPIIKKVIHKKKVEQTMSLFSDLLELEEMEEEVDEIIIKNSVNVYKLNTDTIYLIFGSNNKFHSIVDENLALMPMKLGKLENELKASAVKLKRIFSDKEIELTDEYDIRLSNLFSVYNNCYFLKNIELNDNSSIKGIFITE